MLEVLHRARPHLPKTICGRSHHCEPSKLCTYTLCASTRNSGASHVHHAVDKYKELLPPAGEFGGTSAVEELTSHCELHILLGCGMDDLAGVNALTTFGIPIVANEDSLGDIINAWRYSINLEPVPFTEGPLLAETLKVPFTYCWSPALVPKPADWLDHIGECRRLPKLNTADRRRCMRLLLPRCANV